MSGGSLNIISLGAGVQSSTMALMAAAGEITPMPDCAVFADTQSEPAGVYDWLDWLEKQLPFPVHRVTQGSLEVEALRVRVSKNGNAYQKHSPPLFTSENGRPSGMAMRQCTQDFKLAPIIRKYRQLANKGSVTSWIGISFDEVIRMKPAPAKFSKWLTNTWPLVDRRMTRLHCIEWMHANGYPTPPRSSCVFCPFHSNAEWQRLRDKEPAEFARAVDWEKKIKNTFSQISGFRGDVFLHRDLKPLEEIDFGSSENQLDMFGNECEGMCGL